MFEIDEIVIIQIKLMQYIRLNIKKQYFNATYNTKKIINKY